MDSLILESKALLSKERKASHLEFSSDPVTGRRNCKGTYSPTKRRPKRHNTVADQNLNSKSGEVGKVICELIDKGQLI